MSTDSTELTFVRCPACRSLVPAISSRCRMCGASMEAAAAGEGSSDGEAKKQGGRVRQRTMSESDSELSNVAKQIVEDPVEEPAGEPAAAASNGSTDPNHEDPLRGYIEEVEDSSPAAVEPPPVAEPTPPAPPVRHAEPPPAEAPRAQRGEPPRAEPEAPQRVIVESGGRRGGRESQLSFGRGDRGQAAQSEPRQAEERPERRPPPARAAEPRTEQRTESREQNREPQRETRPPRQEEQRESRPPRQEEPRDSRPRSEEPRQQRREERPREQRAQEAHSQPARQSRPQQEHRSRQSRPEIKVPEEHGGRLFGWFVSFSDPAGNSIEIREGKFFISGQKLKPSDLVMDDPSVSTPHAMVHANARGGLLIQDLMSERGVFIRRQGQESYQREDESVRLEHGDWVRLGDVEFLVSLIAHVGEA